MSNCPTCKESILNQTESLIGKTQCNDPCPQAVTCEEFIPSSCVFYSGPNLTCSGILNSDTITVALAKIENKICGFTTPCNIWYDVTYDDPLQSLTWRDAIPSEVKYSNLICDVKFKGACIADISPSGIIVQSQLFELPIGLRPEVDRTLSVNVTIGGVNENNDYLSLIIPAIILVRTTGEVIITFTNYNPMRIFDSTCTECSPGIAVAGYAPYFKLNQIALTALVGLDGLSFQIQLN